MYLIFILVLTLCFPQFVILTEENIEAFDIDFDKNTYKEEIEWAFSPIHTTYLAKEEYIIYKLIQKYKNSTQKSNSLLESYTDDYIESTKLDDDIKNIWMCAIAISSHPLMTYRMIRRFAYDLTDIINDNAAAHVNQPLLEKIQKMNNSFNIPNWMNLEDTMDNILRLQHFYDLSAKDFLRGIIAGKITTVGLTLDQAYDLGKYALFRQIYTEGLDWLETVLFELKVNPDQGIDIHDVLDTISELTEEHDAIFDSIGHDLQKFYNLSLNIFSTKINTSSSSTNIHETLKSFMRKNVKYEPYVYRTYTFMDTCNGINVKTPAEMSKLYCYFDTKLHPIWKINPLKIEIHSWDPYVIQIYDIIGDKIIEYLQDESVPGMSSTVIKYDEEGPQSPFSSDRTSSYAFLYERGREPLLNLEKKIGYMTGLKVDNIRSDGNYIELEASEPIQVSLYGVGCHLSEHLDALENLQNETTSDDRIGSFMLYLNNVESGGYTAFPVIKLAVPPVKGSVLFWYDLMKNGKPDRRTLHGGCPVILGRKWIATKWIRHYANFRKRPCSLDPLE